MLIAAVATAPPIDEEVESAQSEAATGKPFSRHWCHGAFLLTDGAKMAKRVGNVFTVRELREQGVSAAAIRSFVFTTHYRKELNLSDEALEAAGEAVRRVGEFAARLESSEGGTDELVSAAETALSEFRAEARVRAVADGEALRQAARSAPPSLAD